jgi:tetratricopeptide (TPR) repeat protein
MVLPFLFFVTALAVKQDQTPLRSGCEAADETVATLSAGTPVQMRFRLADGSECFKIEATLEGKLVSGYLPSSALTGVDRVDRERTSAASVEVLRELLPVEAETKKTLTLTGDASLAVATQLLDSNQPAQAFALLERAVPRYRDNANVLLLAGLAAYRSDQLGSALEYWKRSLDKAPDAALQRVYDKVRREVESDRSGEKLIGLHINLRYEGRSIPTETARQIIGTLDQEYSRISEQLGCSGGERIVAIVQTREAYLRSTGAAEWSGGQYDGRIHISLADGEQVGPHMRRALAHELVHACLSSLSSGGNHWPAWLQEGLAQRLSGDTLSTPDREHLRRLAEAHTIPRLENLRQDWSRLSIENARLAYNLSLAAADALFENYENYGLRNIVNNPASLPRITADLDRKLGL